MLLLPNPVSRRNGRCGAARAKRIAVRPRLLAPITAGIFVLLACSNTRVQTTNAFSGVDPSPSGVFPLWSDACANNASPDPPGILYVRTPGRVFCHQIVSDPQAILDPDGTVRIFGDCDPDLGEGTLGDSICEIVRRPDLKYLVDPDPAHVPCQLTSEEEASPGASRGPDPRPQLDPPRQLEPRMRTLQI